MNDPIIQDSNNQITPFLPGELLYIKIGFLVIIIGISFFFGLMPLFW